MTEVKAQEEQPKINLDEPVAVKHALDEETAHVTPASCARTGEATTAAFVCVLTPSS